MSGIQVVSQNQKLVLDAASQSIGVINTGPQGPAGVQGPSEASLVLDTDGQLLTRALGELSPISRTDLAQDPAFKTVVNHGSTAGTTRTNSHPIFWIGSVDPTNAANDDELYRTDQTAKYVRVSGSWVEVGSNRYINCTKSASAPTGTGNNGEWFYDTTNDRVYMSDGADWIVMYEPIQTVNATTTNITLGTNGSVKHNYRRSGGTCFCTTEISFGTSGTKLSLTSGHTITLPKTPKRLQSFSAVFFHGGLGVGQFLVNGSSCQFSYVSTLAAALTAISDTTPWTWALNDAVNAAYSYEMNTAYL